MTQSMTTLDGQPIKMAKYRDPNHAGFGVFEHIGGDLSLIKPGMELSDMEAINDVKELAVKIYRSTNIRY